jgi:hypothetical protein
MKKKKRMLTMEEIPHPCHCTITSGAPYCRA